MKKLFVLLLATFILNTTINEEMLLRHDKQIFLFQPQVPQTMLVLSDSVRKIRGSHPRSYMAIKAEYEKRKEDLKKRYVQVQPVQRNIPTVGARVVGYDPYIEFKGDHLWYAGNCTRYVASEYDIPWTGNAATWDDQAAQHGYEVDATPREGDIYQSNEGPYGHVAIVRNVDGDTITIEEMNYQGYGVISERTVEVTDDMQFIKMQ